MRAVVAAQVIKLFEAAGDVGLFGFRAIGQSFKPPFEFSEIIKQMFAIGWRSVPLLIVSGFAFGVVLALQTRASMEAFGAQAMIPQAVSFGLYMSELVPYLPNNPIVIEGYSTVAHPTSTLRLGSVRCR